MTISYPPHVDLARTPTPLEHLPRTSDYLGVDFYVKRDDMTGVELSGNKVRKLEFLFADALAQGADTVITGGGEQSNHCRATALAATRLGLRSVVLLRTTDKSAPPKTGGNILLDQLAGAEIRWIDHADWARRTEVFAEEADRQRAAGREPYVIPEGGSNEVGAWGYVACAEELAGQIGALPPAASTTVLHACGSGGTSAGLVLGAELLGFSDRGIRVASVNVCDDRDYFVRAIGDICDAFAGRYDTGARVSPDAIEIVDGYVGAGYAKSRDEELCELRDLARRDALILDPVYTGKAFYGLVQELRRDPRRFGDRVVFVHTGGLFGLFPAADRLAAIL